MISLFSCRKEGREGGREGGRARAYMSISILILWIRETGIQDLAKACKLQQIKILTIYMRLYTRYAVRRTYSRLHTTTVSIVIVIVSWNSRMRRVDVRTFECSVYTQNMYTNSSIT